MTERFERIVIMVLATSVILLGIWFYYSVYVIRNNEIEILGYQSQIDQLQTESEEQTKRFEGSRRAAEQDMQQRTIEMQSILATKVPKDCNEAMDWGRRAARAFR